MKYWYDTEFVDDGEKIHLLSIGIVAEDGREYYAVNYDTQILAMARQHPWLKANVVNQLPIMDIADGFGFDISHPDYYAIKPKHQMKEEITAFLRYGSTEIEYWAWYAAYDHVVLSQIFGRMLDLPTGFPMWTNDIKQEHKRLGYPRIPEQTEGAHNALEDARWNRTVHQYLTALDGPVTRVPEPLELRGWATQGRTANPKRIRL